MTKSRCFCHLVVILSADDDCMRISALVVIFTACLSGCAASSPSYLWHHPQGGEYLFAFDEKVCSDEARNVPVVRQHDVDGPFFACMYEKGYYLVNEDGIVRAPDVALSQASLQ